MQFGAGTRIIVIASNNKVHRRKSMAELNGGNIPVEETRYNDVQIAKVSNGFIVRVGCKTFVSKTWEGASVGLSLYFKDPNAARKQYCEDEKVV